MTASPGPAGDPRPGAEGPARPRVLLLFLDGVGIGPADPDRNPFLRARLPVLRERLGGIPTLEDPHLSRRAGRAGTRDGSARSEAGPVGGTRNGGRDPESATFPLDATLDTVGTPQSGTGHTSLLTGINAARRFGRHFGPWVPVALRPVLEEGSVLRRVLEAGGSAAFANAYPRDWPGGDSRRRVAGAPLAARAAGLLTRHVEALREGRAVASEIVNDGWIRHLGHRDLPRPTPPEAGAVLAAVASRHDLTVFAHYSTDLAGHRGGMEGAVAALERVDAFLGGILDGLPADTLLVVASDHGNIEDASAGHTRNPALGALMGPGAADRAAGLASITDVAPAILRWTTEGG